MVISGQIFRAYDIRGVVDESLTEQGVYLIGRALGTQVLRLGGDCVVVGRDGRLSSPRLAASLIAGINATGCNVVDIGLVATPVLYFAAEHLGIRSAVMVTGSHNPPDYNGLKIVLNGVTLYGVGIQRLFEMIEDEDFVIGEGWSRVAEILTAYIAMVAQGVTLGRAVRIVVDCGNGAAGVVAADLYRRLGCEVMELYCTVDGNFPNHHPDPSNPHNLRELIAAVQRFGADVGLAFDGDGDRLGVVDNHGNIIWPDRLLMLLAQDVLQQHPGSTIIYDIKCSREVANVVQQSGGIPLMWRTGHSLIKAKMRETGALLAAEMSGHIFFADRWYGFDDALYTGARFLELLSNTTETCAQMFTKIPELISTPEINLDVTEDNKFKIIENIINYATFTGAQNIITLDGIRVEYADGWGLLRASNTTPKLVGRFEAIDEVALVRIKAQFRHALQQAAPGLEVHCL